MGVFQFVCVLWVVLLIQPDSAFGTRRPSNFITNPLSPGICASAVTIYGFKCQEIDVTTEDGYILSVQRIPEGRNGSAGGGKNRQPVLLQHGLMVDGVTWLLNSPEQSLAMILADHGYDVWIANTRGTKYSRRHVSLDPITPAYWNWSWDELASRDLPAVISYIFQQTNQKIHYVGHSLGTLTALTSFSEGRLMDKLKSAALLSPIAYLSHMNSQLGLNAARVFGSLGYGLPEFNPNSADASPFLGGLCADPKINCFNLIMSSITGQNCCLNASTMEVFISNEPQPSSTKNMVHLSQIVGTGSVAKFNYGNPVFNMAQYGVPMPPIYNLSNIPKDFPLFLTHGGQDYLSDPADVATLLNDLKSHDKGKITVQYVEEYGHADFIMAVNAKDLVYGEVISFFQQNQ